MDPATLSALAMTLFKGAGVLVDALEANKRPDPTTEELDALEQRRKSVVADFKAALARVEADGST